jgi:hypothetical protein
MSPGRGRNGRDAVSRNAGGEGGGGGWMLKVMSELRPSSRCYGESMGYGITSNVSIIVACHQQLCDSLENVLSFFLGHRSLGGIIPVAAALKAWHRGLH